MNSLGLFLIFVQVEFTLFFFFVMIINCLFFFLLSNAVTFRRDKAILYFRVLIITMYYSKLLIFIDFFFLNLNKGIGIFGGLYNVTHITHIFHFFLLFLSFIIICLNGFYPRKPIYFINNKHKFLNKTIKQFRVIEYPLIILFIITGGLLIISSKDLISIFLSLELQSYGLYIISTFYRNSELSTSAGLIYFLLGSLSSCFVLLGSSILYINCGITYLEGLYIISNISNMVWFSYEPYIYYNYYFSSFYAYEDYIVHISLLIISVGLLFKISGAPLHFWSPDVYDSIPTITTTFVAIIAKISIFLLLIQLIRETGKVLPLFGNFSWKESLFISSYLSLIIGGLGGLTQLRIKRLYAYSAISHVGFILLAISIYSISSIQASFFYIIQYSISNLNAFILLLSIGYSYYYLYNKVNNNNNNISLVLYDKYKKENNNSPIQNISQLRGFFYLNPILSLSLIITLFSFMGIPPLLGFFGKQMVLSSALMGGYYSITIVAIISSVISAVYYLAIIKEMVFINSDYKNFSIFRFMYSLYKDKPLKMKLINESFSFNKLSDNKVVLSSSITTISSIFTLILVLFIINPQESFNMTNILSFINFNI